MVVIKSETATSLTTAKVMPAVRVFDSVLKRVYNNKKREPSAKKNPQLYGQRRKTTRYTKVN